MKVQNNIVYDIWVIKQGLGDDNKVEDKKKIKIYRWKLILGMEGIGNRENLVKKREWMKERKNIEEKEDIKQKIKLKIKRKNSCSLSELILFLENKSASIWTAATNWLLLFRQKKLSS